MKKLKDKIQELEYELQELDDKIQELNSNNLQNRDDLDYEELTPHWSDFIPGYGIWHARYAFLDIMGGSHYPGMYGAGMGLYHIAIVPGIIICILEGLSLLEKIL